MRGLGAALHGFMSGYKTSVDDDAALEKDRVANEYREQVTVGLKLKNAGDALNTAGEYAKQNELRANVGQLAQVPGTVLGTLGATAAQLENHATAAGGSWDPKKNVLQNVAGWLQSPAVPSSSSMPQLPPPSTTQPTQGMAAPSAYASPGRILPGVAPTEYLPTGVPEDYTP
jgi:hypothetical protein